MISYKLEGTSHGAGYTGSIAGVPSGIAIDTSVIDGELMLRKCGIGRSSRQSAESDTVIIAGLANGITTGGDITFAVANGSQEVRDNITALRSGHIDVVVANTYGVQAVRAHNEMASARSSVGYVVVGSICRQVLATMGITLYSYTTSIGGVVASIADKNICCDNMPLMCSDSSATEGMIEVIEQARLAGDSVGGTVLVVASGVAMGLGYHTPYSRRLDGIIAGTMMSIPTVKAVSFGIGSQYAGATGKAVIDKLTVQDNSIVYDSNNCGGIVGGMTTGRDIVVELTIKPIPTVVGADSIDSITLQPTTAHYERADTCVVPNVGVIARNMLAICLLDSILDKE